MNIVYARILIIGFIFITLAFSGCQTLSTTPAAVDTASPDDWQTYTSTEYNFSIQYLPSWQFKEMSVLDNSVQQDQVWFAAELPPSQTDARPDLTLILTQHDPSPYWGPEYFSEYQSEIIKIGNGTATRITGVNRESLYHETVVIMKLGDVYLQMLPGSGDSALEAFDRILDTFDSVEPPNS